MSKSKKGFTLKLKKRSAVGIKKPFALNQKSAVMRDNTKYTRKPKHRQSFDD